MNKVIRTARIADRSVRLGEVAGRKAEEAPPAEAEEAESGGFVDLGEQAEEVEATAEAEPEAQEDEAEAEAEEALAEAFAQEQPEEEPEEEQPPTYSALEVEGMVEERLKEFEARYQTEKEEAYRSGFEDGKAEGLKEGQAQSREEIERFKSVLENLQAQWEDHYKNTDLWLVDLVLAVAQRVVGAAAQAVQAPVLQAVRECLDYLQDKTRVVIRVNPEDLEVVRRHRNDWLESLEGIEQLLIEGDADISRGGCVVETPKGDVDAQIEERLERLRTALVEGIRSGDEEEGGE